MIWRILGVLLLLIVALAAWVVWAHRPLSSDTLADRYMTAEDRFVTAAGMDWRVRESGPATAPAIVLIHGFSHTLEGFDAWSDGLDGEYRVIRFDLPGHGLTGPRADGAYSNEATTEQVAALLDVVAPERFVIGGNSLGGLIAWRYAAAHPDRIDGLVLVSAGGYPNLGVGDEALEAPSQLQFFLKWAPEAGVRQATEALYRLPATKVDPFTLPDPEPALSEITAPALILWGARDAMIPVDHAARFDAALTESEAVVLDGVGHMAMEEAPERTLPLVRGFLDQIYGALADAIAAE